MQRQTYQCAMYYFRALLLANLYWLQCATIIPSTTYGFLFSTNNERGLPRPFCFGSSCNYVKRGNIVLHQSKRPTTTSKSSSPSSLGKEKRSRYDEAAEGEIVRAQKELLRQAQQLETKAAITSLKRLLEKQREDLEETEQLLYTMEATMEESPIEEAEAKVTEGAGQTDDDEEKNGFNIGGIIRGVGNKKNGNEVKTNVQADQWTDVKPAAKASQSALASRYKNDTRTASVLAATNYGFISRSEGARSTLQGGFDAFAGEMDRYGPPQNVWSLGWQQFFRNLNAIRGEYEEDYDMDTHLSPRQQDLQDKLSKLTLNTTAIWERERLDPDAAHEDAPFIVKVPYYVLCVFLDRVFEGRYVPSRFFFLETVARMPYFSYIAMLHTYETLGFWRRSAAVKRIHFAEEWNEFHHLLIMESLGGDQRWWVRFLAQHSAIAYFFALVILFLLSPSSSYKFSEMLETHAVHTYSQFLDENEKLLKTMPPPIAAVEYYTVGASDPLFSEYQTGSGKGSDKNIGGSVRRPGTNMQTLYDVFNAIRDDEGDHVSTMEACLDPTVAVRSPASQRNFLTGVALTAATASLLTATSGEVGFVDVTSLLDLANSIGASISGSGVTDPSAVTDVLSSSGALEGASDAVDVAEVASTASGVFESLAATAAAAAAAATQVLKDGGGEATTGDLGAGGLESETAATLWEVLLAILSKIR